MAAAAGHWFFDQPAWFIGWSFVKSWAGAGTTVCVGTWQAEQKPHKMGKVNAGLSGSPSTLPSAGGSRVCETCCICLDDEATAHPFPCCGRETSTQRCCAACLERVCHQIGQCPSCRAALHWDERRSVAVLGHAEPPPRRSRDLLWTLTLFMMQPFGFAALKLLEGTARLLFGDQQPFGLAFSFYRVIPRGGPFH